MYNLNVEQIEFILNDIKSRGVEMEDLQSNLLDHICCIIEQNLEENGDFEGFYSKTIKTFFKKELKEIEVETITLVTNKHYYTMKKVMINSGIFSASLLSLGILFKFMHWPGSAPCIVLGMFLLNFVFLPLVFTLKIKEGPKGQDKVLIGLGTLAAILMSLSVLFRVQHWPGAMVMGYLTIGILLLIFLPIYLTSGIKRPEAKVNTIVSSVLLVTGCSLWLMLVISPAGVKLNNLKITTNYFRSEQLLKNEQKQTELFVKNDGANMTEVTLRNDINKACEELKTLIIEQVTGHKSIDADFESTNVLIGENWLNFSGDSQASSELDALKRKVEQYNEANSKLASTDLQIIPVKYSVLDASEFKANDALNDLVQIQMFVLQNERELAKNGPTQLSKI
jgi:hypothetical protein